MSPPIITLLTDFGTADAYAGIVKGVILGLCPEVRIVDLTHNIPPHGIVAGALVLRSAVEFFPASTIHLGVVDPGVGGTRAPVLVQTGGAWLIGPDNGLLHPAATLLGVRRVFALNRTEHHLSRVSHTFHGRDVFAPVAANLARGFPPESLGEPIARLAPLALPLTAITAHGVKGEIVYADHFGNLVTNITREEVESFHGPLAAHVAGSDEIAIRATYSEVNIGEAVAVIGSWDYLEIAVREASAAEHLSARVGDAVEVRGL